MSEEEQEAIEEVKSYIEWVKDRGTGTDKSIEIILNLIDRLQKELEQEKENNEKQFKIDTAEEVLKWKGKYHLLSRKINGVLEDKIKDKIKELEEETKEIFDKYGDMVENKAIQVLKELLKENKI